MGWCSMKCDWDASIIEIQTPESIKRVLDRLTEENKANLKDPIPAMTMRLYPGRPRCPSGHPKGTWVSYGRETLRLKAKESRRQSQLSLAQNKISSTLASVLLALWNPARVSAGKSLGGDQRVPFFDSSSKFHTLSTSLVSVDVK